MKPPEHSCIPAIQPTALARLSPYPGLIALAFLLLIQPACLFRKHTRATVPQAPAAAIRIALLPFNIPSENSDLRWVSFVAPLVMAKSIENSPAFEVVPLWQSYPVALESLGSGRNITPEVAAYVASRVGAKWATAGELTPAKGGVWMRVDFIPAKTNLVPYRFERETHLDGMAANFYEAFSQFGRYLVLRPLAKFEGRGPSTESMRPLAEALDREYGWYTAADPGKSENLVAGLQRTDSQLAKLLFNPSLYSSLGTTAGIPKPVDLKPAAALKPDAGLTPPLSPPQPPSTPILPPGTEPAAAQKPPAAQTTTSTAPPTTATAATLPIPPARKGTAGSAKAPKHPPPAFKSGIPPSAAQPEETPGAKAAPGAEDRAPSSSEGGSFQIQVYSTQRKESADAKAASLAKEGYKPSVEQVEIKDRGIWYRIRLQGFKSRADAKAAGDKLIAEKLIKQYWIVL
jgi:cell division protein FtsN